MKKMRKAIALILAVVLALVMTACGGSKTESKNRLEQIKERGYIEVCTEPYFAPNEFIDSSKQGDEQYVGMDIEIAKYIADKLGVELRLVPLEFSAVLSGITEGKYDLAISALGYTKERAESMNMSKGYHFDDDDAGSLYGFLVREEDADKYPTAECYADAVIVTQSGSMQEGFVNAQIPKMKEFKLVSSMTDGFLMVSEGKADACACAIENAQLYADANGGLAIANGFRFVIDESTQGTRIGIPLGEEELTEFVNQCIDELLAEGKTNAWYEEYSEYARSLGIE